MAETAVQRLAELRLELRRYLAWAEEVARAHGTTPAHFQLMLAVLASPSASGPTISELAEVLLLRHHSAVGLVDRASAAGLVQRERDEEGSFVHVRLTADGERLALELAGAHLEQLSAIAPRMRSLWTDFSDLPARDEPGR